ncbi:MAG TPA: amidohydrolase [Chitinophagaceae bacterium]|nr:amidohydrolase [Chitinophagaceae bacterium]
MSTLSVTVIQSHLFWEDKAANLRMFEEKILGIREHTEIVLLPEMFSTGFSMQPELLGETMEGETLQWMKRIAAEKKIILAGSVIIRDKDASGASVYFNRLIWMLPTGRYGIYDKRHRFAFAGEDLHYTAGNKRLIASAKGWRVNLLVCYDLRFPVWARQNPHSSEGNGKAPEYDLLVYVANWPERRIEAWKTLLQARAIENQSYVIGVNRVGKDGNDITYSGDSMIVGPMGEILYQKNGQEDIFTITLDKTVLESTREKYPFWKDADEFKILAE